MAIDPDDFEVAMDLAKWIELELRLPTGFVCALLSETDWGFVVKLNAIFESLLNVSITRSLLSAHTTGLEEIITRLDLADHRRGKIAIAAQLGLIAPEDRRFLEALAELRNQLAHSVQNLGFEFSAWVALMDDNQRKACARKFTGSEKQGLQDPKGFVDSPKEYVFCGAIDVMCRIHGSTPPAWQQTIRREATIDLNEILSGFEVTDEAYSDEEGKPSDPS